MVMFRHKGIGCVAALIVCSWMPRAAVAEEGRIDSRMFELTYADAKEVADNFNRTWRGRVVTNGVPFVGDMAVPFIEANSVMVTAPEAVLDNCAATASRGRCTSRLGSSN